MHVCTAGIAFAKNKNKRKKNKHAMLLNILLASFPKFWKSAPNSRPIAMWAASRSFVMVCQKKKKIVKGWTVNKKKIFMFIGQDIVTLSRRIQMIALHKRTLNSTKTDTFCCFFFDNFSSLLPEKSSISNCIRREFVKLANLYFWLNFFSNSKSPLRCPVATSITNCKMK